MLTMEALWWYYKQLGVFLTWHSFARSYRFMSTVRSPVLNPSFHDAISNLYFSE
jgi:hypothetical protein